MAYWVKQSLLMSSDQMIYCSAKQKQYRTNMEGCKIQSGATLPNKAVRTEQLLFLYSVSEQLIANHEISPYLQYWVASPKSTQCCKSPINCNAFKIFLPLSRHFSVHLVWTMSAKGATSSLLHSPSSPSSPPISAAVIQGNLMNAVKYNRLPV